MNNGRDFMWLDFSLHSYYALGPYQHFSLLQSLTPREMHNLYQWMCLKSSSNIQNPTATKHVDVFLTYVRFKIRISLTTSKFSPYSFTEYQKWNQVPQFPTPCSEFVLNGTFSKLLISIKNNLKYGGLYYLKS